MKFHQFSTSKKHEKTIKMSLQSSYFLTFFAFSDVDREGVRWTLPELKKSSQTILFSLKCHEKSIIKQ